MLARIGATEIEAGLAGVAGLEAIAVCAATNTTTGAPCLVAFIVGSVADDALHAAVRAQFPDEASLAAIVPLEALPRSPGGEVDRTALEARAAEAVTALREPRTATEVAVAAIWHELGCTPAAVDDDFFLAGGHSLLAAQLGARLSTLFAIEVPLPLLFDEPTVAAQAAWIDRAVAIGRPRLERDDRRGSLPLSYAQERMWFFEALTPGTTVHRVQRAFRIEGALDRAALLRAIDAVARRHEALRTIFVSEAGQPCQRILGEAIREHRDLERDALPSAMADGAAIRAHCNEELRRPFELSAGPLWRTSLVRLLPEVHVLVVTLHHLVVDAWSVNVWAREVAEHYRAERGGRAPIVERLAVQPADVAAWQRRAISDGTLDPHRAYWRATLARLPPGIELPADHPRPASPSYRGHHVASAIAPAVVERLRAVSRRRGCTLFMTLLAAFDVLLARLSGQEDLIVGTPVGNRERPETRGLIGLFLNTIPIRVDASGDPTFEALLERVRVATQHALAHAAVPYERIVADLAIPREPGRHPMFDVMLNLVPPSEPFELDELRVTPIVGRNGSGPLDLVVTFIELDDGGLAGSVRCAEDLFDATSARRLARRFEAVVAALAAAPELPLSRTPVVDDDERALLVACARLTEVALPPGGVHDLFEAQVRRAPDALAVDDARGTRLSYAQLARRVDHIAQALIARGVTREAVVAIHLERSTDLAAAVLAVLAAGAAFVLLDPALPPARLAAMLDDAAPRWLVTQRALVATLPAEGPDRVILDATAELVTADLASPGDPLGDGPLAGREHRAVSGDALGDGPLDGREYQAVSSAPLGDGPLPGRESWEVNGDELAYLMYTSGSTGRPKGIAVSHRALVNRLTWVRHTFPFAPGEVVCQKTPIGFIDTLWELLGPLTEGVPCVLPPEDTTRDPAALAELLDAHGVTRMMLVPSLLRQLLRVHRGLTGWLPRLSLWQVGGEELPADLAAAFRAARPDARLVNLYGLSEVAGEATWHEVTDTAGPRVPIGVAGPNVRTYVVDPGRELAPIGVWGELWIGGAGVARGYHHRPDDTAARFLDDPFHPGGRVFRTGDRARRRGDGALELAGRLDGQLKIRGVRIEPAEVEAALRRHPAIHDAVVTAVRGPDGENRLVAYVVPESTASPDAGALPQAGAVLEAGTWPDAGTLPQAGAVLEAGTWPDAGALPQAAAVLEAGMLPDAGALPQASAVREPGTLPQASALPDARALRQFLRGSLAEPLIPSHVIALAALPLGPAGKVDLAALPPPDLSPATGGSQPLTATELVVAEAWAAVLESGPVGLDDDFFALGGYSLLVSQLAVELGRAFAINVPLALLFEASTVAAQAAHIDELRRAGTTWPALARAPRAARMPLSYAQERIWFFEELTPGTTVHRVQRAFRIEGALDRAALVRAIDAVARRHEALRTVFVFEAGQPCQQILEEVHRDHRELELEVAPGDRRGAGALHGHFRDELRRPFELPTGPLWRTSLVRLVPEVHVLVLTLHHLIADAWSLNVWAREITEHYRAERSGQAPIVERLAVQPADVAAWQRRAISDGALDPHRAYWRTALARLPPGIELPADHPRPASPSYRGHHVASAIAPAVVERLRAVSRRRGCTLFMTLLAAFDVLLARLSGQVDLVVGTPVGNREHPETRGLIGLFLNMIPIRVDASGDPTFEALLERVRVATQHALAHAAVPYERIVADLAIPREPGRHPMFDVMLNLVPPSAPFELDELRVAPIVGRNGSGPLDLVVTFLEQGDGGLAGSVRCAEDLFDATSAQRLARRFEAVVAALAAAPELPLSRTPVVDDDERALLVACARLTEVALPPGGVHDLFEAQVRRAPDALAVDDARGTRLSYAQLARRVDHIAQALIARGVTRDALVAIHLERSTELAAAVLAVLAAGAAFVLLDPALPPARLAAMLDDAAPRWLVTQRALVATLPAEGPDRVILDATAELVTADLASPGDPLGDGPLAGREHRAVSGDALGDGPPAGREHHAVSGDALGDRPAPERERPPVTGDELAYLMYTSGSTGRPKGIAVSHRALVNRLTWVRHTFPFAPGEVVCQKTPIGFIDTLWELLGPLTDGVPCVLPPEDTTRDPAALAELLDAHGVTRMMLVPSLLRQLLRVHRGLTGWLPQLTLWQVGGEELPADLAAAFRAARPDARLVNLYGLSEVAGEATWHDVTDTAGPRVPIGVAGPNVRTYVVDPGRELAPIGVWGELWIGGAGVARGYHHRPDDTAARFLDDPFHPGGRVFRTGDRARRRGDGALELAGRLDGQLKIRGVRVEPAEVEAALRRHAAIHDAVVTAVRGPDGENRLVAYVVPESSALPDAGALPESSALPDAGALPDAWALPQASAVLEAGTWPDAGALPQASAVLEAGTWPDAGALPQASAVLEAGTPPQTSALPDARALRQFLRGSLAEPLIPSHVIALAALPLGPAGKVDLAALPPADLSPATGGSQPLTATELVVAEAWAAVLESGPVGLDDDFFALGGYSLLVSQLAVELGRAFAINVPLALLFEASTVAAQAAHIDELRRAGTPWPALTRAPRAARMPLSYAQERMWFAEAAHIGTPQHILAMALRLRGPLDEDRLERAMTAVAARHEALRTTFTAAGGVPGQTIHPHGQLPRDRAVVDLSGLTELAQRAEILRAQADDKARPFELAAGPPWRTRLLRLDPELHILLVAMHHLVSDGWSMHRWIEEVGAHYAASPGQVLPDLAVQPADVAVWQRRSFDSGAFDRARAYWRERLSRRPAAELPSDGPRGEPDGAWLTAIVPPAQVAAVRALARSEGSSVFMVLLAALDLLVAELTGDDDVTIGTLVAGRDHPLVRPMVGAFLNTLPLRVNVAGAATLRGVVPRARDATRGALAYGDVPFERIVADVNPVRVPRRNPLFDVALNYLPPGLPHRIGDLRVTLLDPSTAISAPFDVMWRVLERGDALRLRVEYRRGRFTAERVQSWLDRYLALLSPDAARA